MNFISVMAVTEEIAREQASTKTGYAPETVGHVVVIVDQGTSSRQKAFIFETTNDVSKHPLYAKARLFEAFDVTEKEVNNGPVLLFGPEVTVGG